jgi:hypothetical protein
MLLDVAGGMTGMLEVSEVTRVISGSILGLVLPFFIIPGALEGIHNLYVRRQHVITTKGPSHA